MERIESSFKFSQAKNCILNSTLVFVLAYLLVFYVVQLCTIVSAFTIGAPMKLFTSFIDFESVNTAASGDIWKSSENIYAIFGTPVLAVAILIIVSTLLLTKWRSERFQIFRFLFWVVVCGVTRLGSGFVAGHLFNLWNINLVTDFAGITFPSMVGKIVFVVFVIVVVFASFYWIAGTAKHIIDALGGNIKAELKSALVYPALFGGIFVNLFFIPYKPYYTWTEPIGVAMIWIGLFCISIPLLKKRYSFVEQSEQGFEDDRRLNLPLLAVLGVMCILIKVFFDNGLLLVSSPYRHYFFENTVLICLFIVVLCFLLYLYLSFRRKKRRALEHEKQLHKIVAPVKDVFSDEDWGVKKYDTSKYKDWGTED